MPTRISRAAWPSCTTASSRTFASWARLADLGIRRSPRPTPRPWRSGPHHAGPGHGPVEAARATLSQLHDVLALPSSRRPAARRAARPSSRKNEMFLGSTRWLSTDRITHLGRDSSLTVPVCRSGRRRPAGGPPGGAHRRRRHDHRQGGHRRFMAKEIANGRWSLATC